MGIRQTTWFAAALIVACAACGGDDDGGFSPVPDTPAALINPIRVWAFSPTDVWFLDGSATVHRFDGSTWSTLATPSTGGLSCIYALSATAVWLCAGEEVLFYDGATFTASDVTTPTGLDGLTSVWASSPTDVWVVGDDAIVGRYNGTAWSRSIVGSPFKSSIWGTSPSNLYALSTFDVMHFDGLTWDEVELPDGGGGGDGQVWGTSASDVWIATDDDHIAHFDGTTWETQQLEIIGGIAAVWGPAPGDVWGGGTAGSITHFNGSSWSELTHQEIGAPYLRQLVSVHGSSASDVWLVGRQLGEGGSTGLIYHRGE